MSKVTDFVSDDSIWKPTVSFLRKPKNRIAGVLNLKTNHQRTGILFNPHTLLGGEDRCEDKQKSIIPVASFRSATYLKSKMKTFAAFLCLPGSSVGAGQCRNKGQLGPEGY